MALPFSKQTTGGLQHNFIKEGTQPTLSPQGDPWPTMKRTFVFYLKFDYCYSQFFEGVSEWCKRGHNWNNYCPADSRPWTSSIPKCETIWKHEGHNHYYALWPPLFLFKSNLRLFCLVSSELPPSSETPSTLPHTGRRPSPHTCL